MRIFQQTEPSPLYLRLKGEIEGPYELDDVRKLLARAEILPTTLARQAEGEKWTPVSILLEPIQENGTHTKISHIKPRRRSNLAKFFCVAVIVLISLASYGYLELEQQRKDLKAINSARATERDLRDSVAREIDQTNIKTMELENLNSLIAEQEFVRKDNEDRINRLQSDLKEATEKLDREVRKSSILEELSKALATEQQMLRQSLLPAIGLPTDIFLSVQIDPGLLKVAPADLKKAVSSELEAAGFKVIFEVPEDRHYLFVQYKFSQVSNAQGGFAAYTAGLSCFGLAWQSGVVHPMLLFSNHTGGYAGKNSNYSKSVLEDAVMFGGMLADSLEKMDREALAMNYDILDPDEELADAAEKLRELVALKEKPVASTGTGFIVSSKGLIVTNHHVIEGHDQVEIRVPSSGKTLFAQVIATDKSNDLAFLRVNQTNDLPSDLVIPVIARKPPEVGQTVFTVGFPVPEIMGLEPKFSQGVLNAHSGGRDNTRLLQHSIPIQPGNSGGFLVSEGGQVCGVVQSTLSAMVLLGEAGALPQNVNYAIKSERLWDFAADQDLSSELSDGERKPIEAKDALRLSVMITTRVK
jgi:S1-C subfamily serine protease